MLKSLSSYKTQLLTVLIVGLLAYVNTINHEYALDDEYVVYKNEQVQKGFSSIPELFTSHYSITGEKQFGYRPIVKLTFAIEIGLFGVNPQVSHTVNIIIYLLLLSLVLVILRRLLKQYHYLIPFLITIIFALHPMHTEVVASLKNRDELLSNLFAFSSLWMFLRYADNKRFREILIGILLFVLGFYSKPGIMVFAFLIPLTLYFFTEIKLKQVVYFLVILLFVSILLKYFPRFILPPPNRPVDYFENPLFYEGGLISRISVALLSAMYYLGFLVFPSSHKYYYGYDQISLEGFSDPLVMISLVIHLVMAVYIICNILKKDKFAYVLLFYLISISIYTNLFKPVMGIVGERYVFTASFAFAMGLVLVLNRAFKIKKSGVQRFAYGHKILVGVSLVISLVFLYRTIDRNKDWKDHLTLYKADMPKLHKSVKANELLASKLMEQVYSDYYTGKDLRNQIANIYEAKQCYYRILKVYDQSTSAWINLGSMYSNFYNNQDSALYCYERAYKINPDNSDASENIGKIYWIKKNYERSQMFFEKAIQLDSTKVDAISYLSKIENLNGNIDQAIIMNKKLMKIIPDSDLPYINIGNFLYLSGDTIQAISFVEKAIQKNPDNYKVCMKLAEYFYQLGDKEKARHYEHLASKSTK